MNRPATGRGAGLGAYDRANRPWRCGRLSDGTPCHRGPDSGGRCRGMADCAPMRRSDRWQCTRPASAGGPCAAGPRPDGLCAVRRPPCAPVRSLWALRRRATRLAVLMAIGLILIAVHGSEREALLSPGPLTFQHSVVGGCSGCHEGFDAGPAGWVRAAVAVAFGSAPPHDGDHACQTCHDLGPDAAAPHSLPPAAMAVRRQAAALRQATGDRPPPARLTLSAWLFGSPEQRDGAAGCPTCHREHRGVAADLTAMPAEACQSCHAAKFDSFAHGHPAFDSALIDDRPHIAFDHAAHLDRHFAAPGSAGHAPATCMSCHVPEAGGRFMATRAFEPMCGACHGSDIAGAALAGAKGVPFLAVPGLDVRELAARGVEVGDWPRWSEEPVTPFMRRLLAADAGATAALRRLDRIDPLDLRQADADDIRAAATVAVAVKHLLGNLLADGVRGAQTRLAAAGRRSGTGVEGVSSDIAATGTLLGHMPMAELQAVARSWFPRLADELQAALPRFPETIPGPASAGAAATPAPDDPAPDRSDILGAPAPAPDQSDILGAPAAAPDRSDILGAPAPAPDRSDIQAAPTAADPPSASPVPPVAIAAASPAPAGVAEVAPAVDPEAWMAAGGWYRRDFALMYRPTGHADPFLRAWLETAVADGPSGGGHELMTRLGDPRAPGACLKCHVVDRQAVDAGGIDWTSRHFDPAVRGFVRFSHEPHFSLIAQDGCQTCHAVVRTAAGRGPAETGARADGGVAPAVAAAAFAPPTVALCATCHSPGRAGDACTQCHAYHVGRFEAPTVPTPMEVKATAGH